MVFFMIWVFMVGFGSCDGCFERIRRVYRLGKLNRIDLSVLKLIQFYQNHNFCEKKLPLEENKMQESYPLGSIT